MSAHVAARETEIKLSDIEPQFLQYAQVELQFSDQSLVKYRDCLKQIRTMIGDRDVSSYTKADVLVLKTRMRNRGNGISRQVGILSTWKRILLYCRDELGLEVLDPDLIIMPKRPRREVVYLTNQEIQQFLAQIPLTTERGRTHRPGLRFRALVEMLLGSAMRIGELLALDRGQVDFENREALIVGKGGRQRGVFFTQRALYWLERYIAVRTDEHPALFASIDGCGRLSRSDIWRPFARYRQQAGIKKRLTPHILRHTAATRLLFNGCPVSHIKEILGHERLETTCRYYLGLDRRAAKKAHERYLVYS